MASVHPQRHLRLAPITAEVPFADQDADQEAEIEFAETCFVASRQALYGCCFTVSHAAIVADRRCVARSMDALPRGRVSPSGFTWLEGRAKSAGERLHDPAVEAVELIVRIELHHQASSLPPPVQGHPSLERVAEPRLELSGLRVLLALHP